MKIKLHNQMEYSSVTNKNNMSIANKNLDDTGEHKRKLSATNNLNLSELNQSTQTNTTPRVDRVEATPKIEVAQNNYQNNIKQRNSTLNQYQKELVKNTVIETNTNSSNRREQNKKELLEKMTSANDNSKRVKQEFNDSKEKLSTRILEQNDSNIQAQNKLRESKRQLLSEINKTSQTNAQIKQELQQNRRELTSKSIEETAVVNNNEKTDNRIDDNKKTSLQERKNDLVQKVIENTSEDTSIKQKLAQYKRELAVANAKREQLDSQKQNTDNSLSKVELQEVDLIETSNFQLEKIVVKESGENIDKLISKNLQLNNELKNNYEKSKVNKINLIKPLKFNKVKLNKNSSFKKMLDSNIEHKIEKPKVSNIVDFTNIVTPIIDTYTPPNLTSFDVVLLRNNTSQTSNDVAVVTSNIDNSNSNDVVAKQAIISQIAVDVSETSEIQSKLREYQSEVRRINSEILSLTENNKSTQMLSYKNSTEEDSLEQSIINDDNLTVEDCEEDALITTMESILEYASDIDEVEIMLSAQEELNSVIKLLATEIKQEELLAKIAEQEQAIARNKILEKRENLIGLSKQNNELLRTLNQRLAIISKKVTREVVYAPTVITQKTRMIA